MDLISDENKFTDFEHRMHSMEWVIIISLTGQSDIQSTKMYICIKFNFFLNS